MATLSSARSQLRRRDPSRLPSARRRRWPGGASGRAGFSLLEVLVAVLMTATALLLAAQLLIEAQGRMAHAARQAMDPVGEIARRQIGADLRAAAGVAIGPAAALWSRDPLVLVDHPAGRIRYEATAGDLFRVVDSGASGEARRRVLRGVTTFRWRLVAGGRFKSAVEVDLGYRLTGRWGRLAAGGVREAPVPATDRRVFRVTPRGDGGKTW